MLSSVFGFKVQPCLSTASQITNTAPNVSAFKNCSQLVPGDDTARFNICNVTKSKTCSGP